MTTSMFNASSRLQSSSTSTSLQSVIQFGSADCPGDSVRTLGAEDVRDRLTLKGGDDVIQSFDTMSLT